MIPPVRISASGFGGGFPPTVSDGFARMHNPTGFIPFRVVDPHLDRAAREFSRAPACSAVGKTLPLFIATRLHPCDTIRISGTARSSRRIPQLLPGLFNMSRVAAAAPHNSQGSAPFFSLSPKEKG
jgi:hypothetical protein